MGIYTIPTHSLTFTEKIYCVEFCSTAFASSLICIAGEKKLILGLIKFPEESEVETLTWDRVKDLYHESRCNAICFSPETSLVTLPKPVVTFCAAGSDNALRIYRSDLDNSDTVQTLTGHTSYINDIAWDTKGEHLASVSDDHSCKIWIAESNYKVTITFCLSSAGMSVKWHPEEPHKVMVAEKKGIIRFYNIQKQQAILSVETPKCPLMSADWSENNRLFITALAAGEIVTWDLTRSSPADIKQVHEDGGQIVRFSPNNELITASVGRPDFTLKVFSAKSTVPIIESSLKLFDSHCLCWHHPYIVAAEDRKLNFWKVHLK